MKFFRSVASNFRTAFFIPLTSSSPTKISLNHRTSGRNNQGIITARHRGGRASRSTGTQVDFNRKTLNLVGKIARLEYEVKRRSMIALISYFDKIHERILFCYGIKVGSEVVRRFWASIDKGNCLPIWNIPIGTVVHGVQFNRFGKRKLARSAGVKSIIIKRELGKVTLKVSSGFYIIVSQDSWCTIGCLVGKWDGGLMFEKAGKSRWLGNRPTIRGSAMNVVDHPHGGGEGRCPIGRKKPVSLWSY